MPRTEQRFPSSATTPRKARRFVDTTLQEWECDDVREDADLLTGEVVADAVRQAPSQVALLVEHADGVVRVEVSDDPGLVLEPSSADFERRTSRRLLERLTRRWGSDTDRSRTTTWFELLRRTR